MIGFIVGMVMLGGVLAWLYVSKKGDVAGCGEVLGLRPVAETIERRGTSAEGFAFQELLRLRGTISGLDAEVWERKVRRPIDVRYRRQRGSYFSALSLAPVRAAVRPFRLQPVGVMGALEAVMSDAPAPVVSTGDADFDAAYRLYTDDAAAALVVLGAELRRDLLAFRQATAGDLPANAGGYLASALLAGSFEIGPERAWYRVFGTPSRKVGAHLKQAAPLLARLASGGRS
jgi:hypothetical protein